MRSDCYSGSSPSVTSTVCVSPSRTKVTVASLPAAAARTCAVRSVASVIGTPLNAVTMSPSWRPAASGGAVGDDLGDVRAGDRRVLDGCRVADARAEQTVRRRAVLDDLVGHALDDVRRDREADADRAGFAAGAARRRDRDVDADELAVLVDQRAAGVARVDRRVGLDDRDRDRLGRRLRLALALAEVEEERGVCPSSGVWPSSGVCRPGVVCASPASGAADDAIWIERFSALTMPVVTVLDRPSGAPTAMVWSPTLSSDESANSTGVRPSASTSLITARS